MDVNVDGWLSIYIPKVDETREFWDNCAVINLLTTWGDKQIL